MLASSGLIRGKEKGSPFDGRLGMAGCAGGGAARWWEPLTSQTSMGSPSLVITALAAPARLWLVHTHADGVLMHVHVDRAWPA